VPGRSQEKDQLLREGREWPDSRGRRYRSGPHGPGPLDETPSQPWTAAMEATIFTGWIYDHLPPHAAGDSGRPIRSWVQNLNGAAPRDTRGGCRGFRNRHHADYISVHDTERGGDLLYPVNGGEPEPVAGLTESDEVIGGAPESAILYVSPDVSAVPLQVLKVSIRTGDRRPFVNISPTDPAGVVFIGFPIFTADEKQYVSTQQRALSVLYVATGLR
jgi:hypothetical protein